MEQSNLESALVTKDTWAEYASNNVYFGCPFFGYLSATEHLLPVLQNILDKAKTFEELKNELTSLYNERKEFWEYAHDHYPE